MLTENLALHQPAWQSSTWSDAGAERAVDGQYTNLLLTGGQCAVSFGVQIADWWVDLGGVKNIHHVFIQHVTKLWTDVVSGYFLGFSVYISNSTNREDGVLCFSDANYTRTTIPNPVNITCPYHGRYVIYYNTRTHPPYPEGYSKSAYIVLCEVEVYGCPTPGRYGENCSLQCPENCNCDVIGYTCEECVSGYKGHLCYEECDNKTYGLDCRESCGNCKYGEPCHHVNGSCPSGCEIGAYGATCKQSCGNCSNGEPCNHVDGSCPSGCVAGAYGLTCKESCGNCSNGDTCNEVDGSCRYECDVGVYGKTCDKACQSGRYGPNCAKTCGPNCQGCNRFNGVCGCQPGWTGTFCEKRSNYVFR
ncbi:uncharacterized protein LOC144620379 [Crassostrea virginica]